MFGISDEMLWNALPFKHLLLMQTQNQSISLPTTNHRLMIGDYANDAFPSLGMHALASVESELASSDHKWPQVSPNDPIQCWLHWLCDQPIDSENILMNFIRKTNEMKLFAEKRHKMKIDFDFDFDS